MKIHPLPGNTLLLKLIAIGFLLLNTFITTTSRGGGILPPASKTYKGKFFIYWGYNRGWFTDSDIRFYGTNYDFTLDKVKARDRQSKLAADPYLHANKLTIPQTNFRAGYYFKDRWCITIGDDHMKYVMVQNQTVKIKGNIENTATEFNGVYENNLIKLTPEFLIFEHTDGLNYVNVELRRLDNVVRTGTRYKANIDLNLVEGFGAGFLFPRTNTTLMGMERHDDFHVSGYGFSGVLGVNIMFWDHLFLQSELKGGFINMPDIRTTYSTSDKAKQNFFFVQTNILIGINFRLFKEKTASPAGN